MAIGCNGYSKDLRDKVIQAWEKRNLSTVELSELFGLGPATVRRWKKRYLETGQVDALPHGGGRRRALCAEQVDVLDALVQKHPDWTQDEYTEHLQEVHGFKASRSAITREILRLGYTVKKRPSLRSKSSEKTSKSGSVSSSQKSDASTPTVWFLSTKRARTSR